jgi:hypothetical protein
MSTIKVDNLQTTGGAGLYPARAWSTFNGQGTVSITVSEGVSSITDNGTGLYTLNLSNSTTTAYQVISGSGLGVVNVSYDAAPVGRNNAISNATSNVPCFVSGHGPPFDSAQVHVVIVA